MEDLWAFAMFYLVLISAPAVGMGYVGDASDCWRKMGVDESLYLENEVDQQQLMVK
jgi:hypothetical protein